MLAAFALPLVLSLGAQAPPPVCKIAVLNLSGRSLSDADKDMPTLLSEVMTNEVAAASGCDVISQADIRSMADFEATRAECDAAAESCIAELGSALGVDRLVAGSIGRLGADYVINARLVNISTARVEQRSEEVVTGQVEKLRLAAKLVARALFPQEAVASPPSEGPSLNPMLIGGAGVSVLGVVGGAIGGYLAWDGDQKLGDPTNKDKAGAFTEGRAGVALAGVSLVAVGIGGVMAALAATADEPAPTAKTPTPKPAAAPAPAPAPAAPAPAAAPVADSTVAPAVSPSPSSAPAPR